MKDILKAAAVILMLTVSVFFFQPEFTGAQIAEFLRGDQDADGRVSSSDARMILRASVGLDSGDIIKIKADVDSDGKITASDARFVLKASVGSVICPDEFLRDKNTKFIELTDKNYVIYEKDGLTWADGILIANKSYPLPRSYNPGDLSDECYKAFSEMRSAAKKEGLNIYISSGFRSYDQQRYIYNRYVSRDGKKLADTYSARPGHSEHQTGLAIDLNTITRSFAYTAEGRWTAKNCYKFGFILRYPEGSYDVTGYCYEPWHIRYVGKDKAEKIYKSGLTVEEYYGINSEYGR